MIDLNKGSDFFYGPPPPPIDAMITDPGMGKTRAWREAIAALPVEPGDHTVLAVPLHQLGEEVVADFNASGIAACVYRGRDASDPLAPGEKMCREQERIEAIGQALGDISRHACHRGAKRCQYFDVCGYQRQQREHPAVSVVVHQILFQKRPSFIRPPDALGVDESYWGAGLRGIEKPEKLWLTLLKDDRNVPRSTADTADLISISDLAHDMLSREPSGWLRRQAIIDAGLTENDLALACELEWRRKRDIDDVDPGMPVKSVKELCYPAQVHNQDVRKLAIFWELLLRTLQGDAERSPYLYLNYNETTGLSSSNTQPALRMIWCAGIHPTWRAPTTLMNATMVPEIDRQFFPRMAEPFRVTAPLQHTHVRQIVDRFMSMQMLIPSERASKRTNQTRSNNCDRLMEFINVRAKDVCPGRVVVICRKALERELTKGSLPPNVELAHFNAVAGRNDWKDVALLIVIDRTEPPPYAVERMARALFGKDIMALPDWYYPQVLRGVRMRNGAICAIESSQHPDPWAEMVRWSICEGGLLQALGRARAVNRTADDPLQIDILTRVALPIETDEFTTWDLIQPGYGEMMRSRGAVPLTYRDMADAYPDLFRSRRAAQMALLRECNNDVNRVRRTSASHAMSVIYNDLPETDADMRQPVDAAGFPQFRSYYNALGKNPSQTLIEKFLIGICDGFLSISFKRKGFRGPWSKLLYDPRRVDPRAWLAERFGEVTIKGKPVKPRVLHHPQRRRVSYA